jgi:hypothetical protein
MKNLNKNVVLIVFCALILATAFTASAHLSSGIVPCGVNGGDNCNICSLWHLGDHIINFLLYVIALPLLIVVLLAGGIIWLTGAGNPSRIEQGKKLIFAGIIGILIAFVAWLIIDTIIKTLANPDVALLVAWNEFPACF